MMYESRLELARLLLVDFDIDVRAIYVQPCQLSAKVAGQIRRHIQRVEQAAGLSIFQPRLAITLPTKAASSSTTPHKHSNDSTAYCPEDLKHQPRTQPPPTPQPRQIAQDFRNGHCSNRPELTSFPPVRTACVLTNSRNLQLL